MIISHEFEIPQLDYRRRTVRVLLPRNYDNERLRFPVLYMQDGQNLFDAETAAFGDWKIPATMQKMALKKQVIIVGIDNGGDTRADEYAPFNRGNNGGQAEAFGQFIVETVKPFIDREYRTYPQRETTGVGGSSLGGLFAFYAGLRFADVFGIVAVLSPAIWFNPKVLQLTQQTSTKSRFYVVASKTEMRGMDETLQRVYFALKDNGWTDTQIQVVIKDRGRHSEQFWGREFRKVMEWCF